MIDDAFWVKKQGWGTFVSVDVKGNSLVTSYTEEDCIAATRFYLKARQEGFTKGNKTYVGVVDG